MKNLIIIAHRGGKNGFKENSVEAFEHAIREGCKVIEMDIRLNHLKKEFYLEHDFFHRPKMKKNLLSKVVDALPQNIEYLVELKTIALFRNCFARNFVEQFPRFFDYEKTLVQSFNPFVLIQLKKLDPKIRRAYLCGNPFWLFMFKLFLAAKILPESFHLHKRLLSRKNVAFGKSKKMNVISFVLNSKKTWEKALSLGVDGIITDYPKALHDYVSSLSDTNSHGKTFKMASN